MVILDRMVLKLFIKILYTTLFLLVFIFIVSQMLDKSFRIDVPFEIILRYYMVQIPSAIIRFFPFAALFSGLLALNFLNKKSELIAMMASGYSLIRLSILWALIILLNCLVLFILADRLVPHANRAKKNIEATELSKTQGLTSQMRDDRTWYRSGNNIFSVERYNPENRELLTVEIFRLSDEFRLLEHIKADRAHYEKGRWILTNAQGIVFPVKEGIPQMEFAQQKEFHIKEGPEDFSDASSQVETLNFNQTLRYIQRNERLGLPTYMEWTAYYLRFSALFSPLIFLLIGIPFGLAHRRKNTAISNGAKCVGLVLSFLAFEQVSTLMGTTGRVAPEIAAFAPLAVFFFIAVFLVSRKKAW